MAWFVKDLVGRKFYRRSIHFRSSMRLSFENNEPRPNRAKIFS